MGLQFEYYLAKRYLWAQRKNLSSGLIAFFSVAGVIIGTWLLIFVLSASNGFELEVKKQLMGKDAHFEIFQNHYEPITNWQKAYQTVQSDESVVHASPFIMSQAAFAKNKNFSGGVVFGIDPQKSQDVIALKQSMRWGEYRFDSIPDASGKKYDAVIMGYALAARLGILPGEKCILYVFNDGLGLGASFTPRAKVFVLAGTFESGMYQFDETLAYISLAAAQSTFQMRGQITGIQAKIKDPLQSGVVASRIQEKLGLPYQALDWQEKNRTLIKWMEYEKVLMGLALGIIIIIAAFNIISSLVMNVSDKKREIGILRAMGATSKQIARVYILEGCLIAFVGSSVGVFLGLLTCYLQWKFGFIQLPGDVYFVTKLPVVPQVFDIVMVFVITVLLCIVATLIPAYKASRQNPVESIRYE